MTPKHDTLAAFARGLMKQPEFLALSATPSRLVMTTIKGDYSRLVGKQGRHISALSRLGEALGITVVLADPVQQVAPTPATLKEPEDVLEDAVRLFDGAATIEQNEHLPSMTLQLAVRTGHPIPEKARTALDTLVHGIARTALKRLEVTWTE